MKKVTIIIPIVARPETGKKCIESVLKHVDFQYVLKVIIHPRLKKLIEWCKEMQIDVYEEFHNSYAKMRKRQVELCETEYLFSLNCDIILIKSIKPMLDFMETHPDVGTCACAIKVKRKFASQFGRNFKITANRKWSYPRCFPNRKKLPPFHYCDFTNDAAILMRMAMFKNITIDTTYYFGLEHEDLFMEIYHSKWKVVSYNDYMAEEIWDIGPKWFQELRGKENRRKNPKFKEEMAYFKRKWRVI